MLKLDSDAWGYSIILLTLLVKAVTYPLTYTQISSTAKLQVLQPKVKEIQKRYENSDNPQLMNQEISNLYQSESVNPLAGCLPALVQLPVFIGLYRAVLDLAKTNKLDESFLWLDSLEGPTYGADPTSGTDWLLKGWTDAGPSLGWTSTIEFLSIPIILVVSQAISQNLLAPPPPAEGEQDPNAALKFLPLVIGWFSLSVPSALGVYWVANNFVSTAITLKIKSEFPAPPPAAPASSSSAGGSSTGAIDAQPVNSAGTSATTPDFLTQTRDKPTGFGDASGRDGGEGSMKPITGVENAGDKGGDKGGKGKKKRRKGKK